MGNIIFHCLSGWIDDDGKISVIRTVGNFVNQTAFLLVKADVRMNSVRTAGNLIFLSDSDQLSGIFNDRTVSVPVFMLYLIDAVALVIAVGDAVFTAAEFLAAVNERYSLRQ